MRCKIIYLVTLIFFGCMVSAFAQQKSVEGVVKSVEGEALLQYVNIGIADKGAGTVSGSDGRFTLKVDENITGEDTVIFSHIGYITKRVLLKDLFQVNNIVHLSPESEQLEAVLVTLKKPRDKKIGRSSKGLALMHSNFYSSREKDVDDRLSKEMGMKFKSRQYCRVNDFNFNITGNEFNKIKFRLNFYKIENGMPGELLSHKEVIFEVRDGYTGWYKLDLLPYKIIVDDDVEEFAVTIQWLESEKMKPDSKYFALSVAKSIDNDFLYREKAMDTWTKSAISLSFYLNTECQ